MLELDDIQHILLTRTPAITGRYEFLTFDTPAGGRAWVSELIDLVQSAADAQATMDDSRRWITLAFTWSGLRALGVPDESLASFPDEFREGMASRADILGDTGPNHPDNWVGGLAGDDLHAIAILFARDEEQSRLSIDNHDKLLARTDGVRSLSFLDLNATPPFNYAHDHFGFRDRLSQPVMEGSGEEPTPGSGAALKPGEFILGYPDEDGPVANLPQPEVLSRNGSYMAYRRLREHVALFRDYLRENSETPDDEELLAAKFMGRWRSGAPLVLAPDKDDPELGADPMRNNDFNYKEMDPFGYACPLGLPRAPAKSTRHRAQHEPPQDDPARRYLRPRPAGWCARRRRGPRHRRFHHLRGPRSPVRVRTERLDQRQDVPRARQRARPDMRDPRRHTGVHHSQTPHPQSPQGTSRVHYASGGAYFFLPGHQRPALPDHASRGIRIDHECANPGPHV